MNEAEKSGTEKGISGRFYRQLRVHCGVKRTALLDYIAMHARDYGTGLVTTTRGLANLEEKVTMPLIYVKVLEDMIGKARVREIIEELQRRQSTNR